MFEFLKNFKVQVVQPSLLTPALAQAWSTYAELKPAGKGRAHHRMYSAAKLSRLTAGWGQNSASSADTELVSSLRVIRSRSRALVRDAGYAKRAKGIVVNNVIGSGIGMQGNVSDPSGKLIQRINDDIEAAWEDWICAEYCHTGGALHFSDLERAMMGQIFESGEILVREHFYPFGGGKIPYALEMIEPERLCDEIQPGTPLPSSTIRMGVEVDRFYRPVAYWLRQYHQGEIQLAHEAVDMIERVPADQIIHLRIVDRWPQTRGEPWLHAAARKLNDMDGYSEAEIVAARAAASYMGIIESTLENPLGDDGTEIIDGVAVVSNEMELEPGVIQHLNPGEKFNSFAPNRPNAQIDPFMRLMLREAAAGVGTSYESLSKDYSQSNYSSSRLALLDDRDLWRAIQAFFIRSFRQRIHKRFLQQAVFSKALKTISVEEYATNIKKYEAVKFKPRGWSWIDPTSEVEAYKEAVKGGFTTVTRVIAQTGDGYDLEDMLTERQHELELAKERGLTFDTDPGADQKVAPPANANGNKPANGTPKKEIDTLNWPDHSHRDGGIYVPSD